MRRQIMVVAACGLLLATVEARENPMDDSEKIQGTWALVSGERNGKRLPDEAIKHVKIIVSGDKLTTKNKERKTEATFKLDPSKKPKEIDESITNGVHVPTWLSLEFKQLFDKYLGGDWAERCDDLAFWSGVRNIPDEELWQARKSLKRFLFAFIRQRSRDRWAQENVSAAPGCEAAGAADRRHVVPWRRWASRSLTDPHPGAVGGHAL